MYQLWLCQWSTNLEIRFISSNDIISSSTFTNQSQLGRFFLIAFAGVDRIALRQLERAIVYVLSLSATPPVASWFFHCRSSICLGISWCISKGRWKELWTFSNDNGSLTSLHGSTIGFPSNSRIHHSCSNMNKRHEAAADNIDNPGNQQHDQWLPASLCQNKDLTRAGTEMRVLEATLENFHDHDSAGSRNVRRNQLDSKQRITTVLSRTRKSYVQCTSRHRLNLTGLTRFLSRPTPLRYTKSIYLGNVVEIKARE